MPELRLGAVEGEDQADGRVVLRDPGNARFTVYGATGDHVESWPARGGTYTSVPIFPVAGGGFYNPVWSFGEAMRLVRYASDGSPLDTLPLPERDVNPPTVTARTPDGRSSQTWNVPFSETALWTFHPDGYAISAVRGRYAIDLLHRDGRVLRLQTELEHEVAGKAGAS